VGSGQHIGSNTDFRNRFQSPRIVCCCPNGDHLSARLSHIARPDDIVFRKEPDVTQWPPVSLIPSVVGQGFHENLIDDFRETLDTFNAALLVWDAGRQEAPVDPGEDEMDPEETDTSSATRNLDFASIVLGQNIGGISGIGPSDEELSSEALAAKKEILSMLKKELPHLKAATAWVRKQSTLYSAKWSSWNGGSELTDEILTVETEAGRINDEGVVKLFERLETTEVAMGLVEQFEIRQRELEELRQKAEANKRKSPRKTVPAKRFYGGS